MPHMKQLSILMPLGLGAIVINTMPVWLAVLADHPQVSEPLAGGLGSLVLLTVAAACVVPVYVKAGLPLRLCTTAAFSFLAFGAGMPIAGLVLTCILLGLALGLVTKWALLALQQEDEPLKHVSLALSFGLIISFAIYLVLSAYSLNIMWLLAAISASLLIAPLERAPNAANRQLRGSATGLPLGYFPFFIMMGAYWSFLELYGQSIGAHDGLAFWLLVSLVTGAIGSFLAGLLPSRHRRQVQTFALLAAALTGAASYISPNLNLLGLSILANGFFLFLFFPLYIASYQDQAPTAMAGYLLGFAFGGLVGALILQLTGYPGLGLTILASGLIAMLPGWGRFFRRS